MAEAVITNHHSGHPAPCPTASAPSRGEDTCRRSETPPPPQQSERQSSVAKQTALEQEQLVAGLLKERAVASLTEEDIQRAILGGSVCCVVLSWCPR